MDDIEKSIDSPEKPSVPEHYKTLADRLEKVVGKVAREMMNRPVPEWARWNDITELFERVSNYFTKNIQALSDSTNQLTEQVLAKENVDDNIIWNSVQSISTPLFNLVSLYHFIWSRPFPSGMEQGQPLLAAMVERVIKDYIDMLDDVILVTKDPEKAVKKHGSLTVRMHMDFRIDEEAKRFNDWLNFCVVENQVKKRKNIRNILLTAFAGFLMHDWFWDDK